MNKEGLAKLRGYGWPGNIRELANVLERAVILSPGSVLGAEALDLPRRHGSDASAADGSRGAASSPSAAPTGAPMPAAAPAEPLTLDEVQRRHIRQTLTATDGRVYGKDGAAARLGMKPSTLQSRMKKLEVDS